jgi:hypothetical protein
VNEDERERAWAAVHDAIAQMPGWAVGRCSYHGDDERWHVAAVDLRPRGRQAKRELHGKDPDVARDVEPICMTCCHFEVASMDGELACAAYPEIIPAAIRENLVDHRLPFKGDGGMRWEQDPRAVTLNEDLYAAVFTASSQDRS